MPIRFSYQPPTAGKHEVGIVGDFTEWKIHSLQNVGDTYMISYDLLPGRYRYKYIVDGVWMPDPRHQMREPDPFGGENSVIIVEESAELLSWEETVQGAMKHSLEDYLRVHRCARDLVELCLVWPAHLADKVSFKLGDYWYLMNAAGMQATDRVWHNVIQIDETEQISIRIDFMDKQLFLGSAVTLEEEEGLWINPDDLPLFEIPEWVRRGVIYQIFMDRFHNGDPGLNQDFSEAYYEDSRQAPAQGEVLAPNREYYHFVEDWYDIKGLIQNPLLPEGKPDWWCFYGGDIPGVRQKLDYLKDLGITIIYFNPLWEAKSVHKYDAADFRKVDPHFGTAAQLQELVSEMHRRGMKVILDVAFNHSGESFWAFQDCVQKGEESRYWHWYDWYKWPLPKPLPQDFKPKEYYQCWWGIKDMPDLNYDLSRRHPYENYIRDVANAEINEDLVNYILDSTEWWISYIGVDGFRLDVPDEVPWWFWELFRKRVKELKPDAWLVGEIWNNAKAWISHKYFDSVMNYAYFNSPVLELFIHCLIDKEEFVRRILTGLGAYPRHAAQAMMNLLGSHDTQRIMQLAKGNLGKVKQAVFFQMTFIGTPHIYYGDEVAMRGGKDPDNRRPFNWQWEKDPVARDMRDFYRSLISLRTSYELFSTGEIEFLDDVPDLLVYRRYDNDGEIKCAINLASSVQSYKETPWKILFTEGKVHRGKEELIFDAYAMCIFR